VIVRNVGPLLATAPLEGDVISNRGFNALVFAGGKDPTHFLKVRPAGHLQFHREAEITVRLAQDPSVRHLVSGACTFVEGPARVLAEEFIDGLALDLVIRKRQRRDWHVLAADVIRSARPLLHAIAEGVGPSDSCAVKPFELLADLELLRSLGLDAAAAQRLGRLIESAPLPMRPQHGDFWPRNILQVGGDWRVLDFESCGEVVLPLYDVFHMIRGCGEAVSMGRRSWLELWEDAGSNAQALVTEVRHAARGLDIQAIEAALAAYLIEFAARLHRRGIAQQRFAGRLQEISSLPALLDTGILRKVLR
jgi:hypothetical protein